MLLLSFYKILKLAFMNNNPTTHFITP